MIHAASRAPHPIIRVDASPTSRTFGAELSVDVKRITKMNTVTDEAACLYKKGGGKGGMKPCYGA